MRATLDRAAATCGRLFGCDQPGEDVLTFALSELRLHWFDSAPATILSGLLSGTPRLCEAVKERPMEKRIFLSP